MATLIVLSGCDKGALESEPELTLPKPAVPEPAATEPAIPKPGSSEASAATAQDPQEKAAEPATGIQGEKFSAPIPAGYTLASEERVAQLGQQFGQKVEALLTRDTSKSSLRESIFITQLDSPELDPTSISQCRKSAKEMIRVTGASLAKKAAIVEYPFGKTCQFALGSGKTHTIQSIAYVDEMRWTVTCKTTTAGRKAGARECNEVLSGFSASSDK